MESPDVDCYGEVALSRQAATRGDQDYGLSLPAEETHRNDETLRYHGPLPLDHFHAAGVHRRHWQHRRLGRGPHLGRQPDGVRDRCAYWLFPKSIPVAASPAGSRPDVLLLNAEDPPAVAFAAAEIRRALAAHRPDPAPALRRVVFQFDASRGAQAYRFRREPGETLRILGGDAAGALYGGLDVAEAVRLNTIGQLGEGIHRPHIAQRGIKFNIPLDLRTPSYSDNSDSAQANIPEMWSLAFWREFLDEMARHRFNVLSLWSLNPFASIVKVPEYPDVALNDVLRGGRERFDDRFSHSGTRMFRPEYLEGAEVVKRLTIDEKIAFWREVMQMSKDRGVDVYWFTWDVFLDSEEGKHGLTPFDFSYKYAVGKALGSNIDNRHLDRRRGRTPRVGQ